MSKEHRQKGERFFCSKWHKSTQTLKPKPTPTITWRETCNPWKDVPRESSAIPTNTFLYDFRPLVGEHFFDLNSIQFQRQLACEKFRRHRKEGAFCVGFWIPHHFACCRAQVSQMISHNSPYCLPCLLAPPNNIFISLCEWNHLGHCHWDDVHVDTVPQNLCVLSIFASSRSTKGVGVVSSTLQRRICP